MRPLLFGASPFALGVLKTVLMLVAVGWAVLLVDAWRLGEPLSLVKNQRLTVVGINGLLCFTVAGTLLFGAHHRRGAARLHPHRLRWRTARTAHHGRYNVLLLGGDSGAGRWGLRPDSMTSPASTRRPAGRS